MRREAVESSSIAAAGYDPARCVLEVEFRNGGVYEYLDVPLSVYRAFLEAESRGRFLNTRIKPEFECRRLRPARRG